MTSPCLPRIVPFTWILYEWVHIVFISWCCWSKIPHTGWLTTTEVTSLKSLEVKSLRSRCYRASLPRKAPKMDLSLTFPCVATQLQSWLHVSMVFLFCVSLYGLLLIRMPAIGFRGHLNPVWPHHNSITSAKTLKSHWTQRIREDMHVVYGYTHSGEVPINDLSKIIQKAQVPVWKDLRPQQFCQLLVKCWEWILPLSVPWCIICFSDIVNFTL